MKTYNFNVLLEKHEALKQKWLELLTLEDLYEWLDLKEKLLAMQIEMRSEYLETKLVNDKDKWLRMIELKTMVDEIWKKVHTDTTASAVINQEFFQKDLDLIVLSNTANLLKSKSDSVVEYINLVKKKLDLDKDFGWISTM